MKYRFSEEARQAGEAVLRSFGTNDIELNTNTVVAEVIDAVMDAQAAAIAPMRKSWPNYDVIVNRA